jgi:hypothetical protein
MSEQRFSVRNHRGGVLGCGLAMADRCPEFVGGRIVAMGRLRVAQIGLLAEVYALESQPVVVRSYEEAMLHTIVRAASLSVKLAVHETNAGPRYVQWRDLGEIWRTGAEVDC